MQHEVEPEAAPKGAAQARFARLNALLHPSRWHRVALIVGALGASSVGMLASGDLAGMSSERAPGAQTAWRQALPAGMRWADEPLRPTHPTAPAHAPAQGGDDPESRLLAIYHQFADGQLASALAAAERLTADFPNFRLAQLALADLTAARARLPASFGTVAAAEAADQAALQALRDEATQRLRALRERPPADAVPAEFYALPATVPYAIAVDTTRARLYLFQNGPKGLHLREDFYVSIGKQGIDKATEGDQKTPLGVYYVTEHIAPHALERRFGVAALWLNYPNAYDKVRGRTGSGILLHGVAKGTYSRPPLDSDGCVSMPNEDMLRLAALLPESQTPVVITREIHWVSAAPKAPLAFESAFKRWQAARAQADAQALAAHYRDPALQRRPAKLASRIAPRVDGVADLSLLTWSGADEVIVATFEERSSDASDASRRYRQYWSREGDDWRILTEGQLR